MGGRPCVYPLGEVSPDIKLIRSMPHSDANISLSSLWSLLASHQQSEEPITVQVVGLNRGGLIAEFQQLRGFIPNSHIPGVNGDPLSEINQKRKEQLIGEMLSVIVLEAEAATQQLIFSARQPQPKHLEDLQPGQIVSGTVVNLTAFGAFVDIGCPVNGLVHISEIAWQRVHHPADMLQPGERVIARVQQVDLQQQRFSLSLKALQPNPWQSIDKRYKVGDLVEGVITAKRRFGYFVRLAAGIEGLLHISEIPANDRLLFTPDFMPGEKILTRVVAVEPEKHRLSLSLQQVSIEEQISWLLHQQNCIE